MKLGIEIDFENTYEITNISADLTCFQFDTTTVDDQSVTLIIKIATNYSPFLPEVYNLAFGPSKEDGTIDDTCIVKHKDSGKVFSTILFGALTFLKARPDKYVGIDGSDLKRAYLYFKMLQLNHDYLDKFFKMYGVKYYIRLLRGVDKTVPLIPDDQDLATYPFRVQKGESIRCDKLFNYFIFNLSQ